VDSAGEQKKPEARKMPENGAESHQSAARFVGQPLCLPKRWLKKDTTANTPKFYTQLNLWQSLKNRLTKTPNNQKPLSRSNCKRKKATADIH
jgi:hypothetical protein